MQNEQRLRALLSDLGRSTLRGIKKCPNCGTYNGIRGHSCKNKACGLMLKDGSDKMKHSMEVCKLNTGTSTQVFSVRVKEKGSESRGFVQLPVTVATGSSNNKAFVPQVSALCFVDSCQRLFQSNILKCHDNIEPLATCSHIQSALQCTTDAQILPINEDILSSLEMSEDIKQEVLRLSNETPGPLVQRASKATFVVKCKVTTKHPLGFVHLTFNSNKVDHFHCACLPKATKSSDSNERKCVHYYSCVAAFSSDLKLTEEFTVLPVVSKHLVQCAFELSPHIDVTQGSLEEILGTSIEQASDDQRVLDATDPTPFIDKTFMLPDDISQEFDQAIVGDIVSVESAFGLTSLIPQTPVPAKRKKPVKKKKESKVSRKDAQRKCRKSTFKFPEESLDPDKVYQSFIEWLSSVTERINQTMHFQFNGKPEPLVFHVPQAFFECLVERLCSVRHNRRRLPDLVTRFTRKHSPPLGTFFNYTWHITNIIQAKAIFDTPLMRLNVTKRFVVNCDGSYEDFDPSTVEVPKVQGQTNIQPIELKTFLKIGKTAPDQVTPSVLSIDWTPDVLPISKIGELKITFEYGHKPEVH